MSDFQNCFKHLILFFGMLKGIVNADKSYHPPCFAGIQLVSQQISDAAGTYVIQFGCSIYHVYQIPL